ncbi:MAG: lysine--tRNA ligase [Patescibacteria group bacterium]
MQYYEQEEKMTYLDAFKRTHEVNVALANFSELQSNKSKISIAGRIMSKRTMGGVIFLDIQDSSGRMQCFCSKKGLAEGNFIDLKKNLKIGDIVGITGFVFVTQTNEKTVNAEKFQILSVSVKNLPEKFHGLNDIETCYRKRYLDLIMNIETRDVFKKRFKILEKIRDFLAKEGFVEVETPIFQNNPCGASANPFKTHHNAMNLDMYLRISPETFLKRLIVGGMEKIFEIGKNFRNEGIDPSHLQEFTMLECYVAYWNYQDNMIFTQRLIREVISKTIDTLQIEHNGIILDFEKEWTVIDYRELVLRDSGIDVLAYNNSLDFEKEIQNKKIDLGDIRNISLGNMIDKLYKKYSRPSLIQPTILVHHPASLIPLARLNINDSRVVDSFQIIVNGWEIVKAYSELADPVLQRKLLEDQAKLRESGDDEAMFLDEDFLESLEYGMPPVSGFGLGIDRLVAIITNQKNLRDVVLFPMMK